MKGQPLFGASHRDETVTVGRAVGIGAAVGVGVAIAFAVASVSLAAIYNYSGIAGVLWAIHIGVFAVVGAVVAARAAGPERAQRIAAAVVADGLAATVIAIVIATIAE